MPRIVFLYRYILGLGGTDTLLVRLANAAARSGHDVFINCDPGPLAHLLDSRVHVTQTTNYKDFLKEIRGSDGDEIHILVFDPHMLMQFLPYMKTILGRQQVKLIYGIFHPRELFPDNQSRLMHRLMHRIFVSTHSTSWLFMNDVGKQSHASVFSMDLANYPTCPILVDHPENSLWTPHPDGAPIRIVSVGRIVPFKAYNWGAIDVIAKLRAANHDVSWTIFGDGEAMASLKQEAIAKGVADAVHYKGLLPYAEFAEELIKYDIFIGMGTALLEAAGLGMPSLIAIDLSPDATYGFFDEGPEDSIGEIVNGATEQKIINAIIAFAQMPPHIRTAKGLACRERAIAMSGSLAALSAHFSQARRWRMQDNLFPLLAAVMWMSFTNLRRIVRRISGKPPLPPFQ